MNFLKEHAKLRTIARVSFAAFHLPLMAMEAFHRKQMDRSEEMVEQY